MKRRKGNPKMSKPMYPCDTEPFECPFNARYSNDCRYHCGLGVDEDEPECDDDYHNWLFEEEDEP
jgi:hypothetical protein